MTMLVTGDSSYLIRHVYGIYPGSCSDAQLLEESGLRELILKLSPYFCIGDAGFILRQWLLTPFRGFNLI